MNRIAYLLPVAAFFSFFLPISSAHAGKGGGAIGVICIVLGCDGDGGGSMPPAAPEPPPPPPEIGADAMILDPFTSDGVTYGNPRDLDVATQAFSMIGDSRTAWCTGGVNEPVNVWEQTRLLGRWRDNYCSGNKTRIHSTAVAGSWAEQWRKCAEDPFAFSVRSGIGAVACILAFVPLNQRVVVQMGGNDVSGRKGEYRSFAFLPIVYDQVRLGVTKQIHDDTHKVVSTLSALGKDVIVQQYELRNPDREDENMDDGIRDLNGFGWRDFGDAPAVQIVEPKPFIGMRRSCTVGLRGIICRVGFVLQFTPIRFVFANKVPRTSFSLTRENFPGVYYQDQVHLNPIGCQVHAMYLNYELKKRCWW